MDPSSPRHEGYRIPRVVVDICAARPIDLAIIDGIDSMGGAEGPWSGGEGCHPGRAGRRHELRQHRRRGDRGDGLRPDGARGREPVQHVRQLPRARGAAGLGTRDLRQIEVAGTPIREARFDFAPLIRSRFPRNLPPYPRRRTHPERPIAGSPVTARRVLRMPQKLPEKLLRRRRVRLAPSVAPLASARPPTGRRAKARAPRSSAWASVPSASEKEMRGSGRSASTTSSWAARRSRGRTRRCGRSSSASAPPA